MEAATGELPWFGLCIGGSMHGQVVPLPGKPPDHVPGITMTPTVEGSTAAVERYRIGFRNVEPVDISHDKRGGQAHMVMMFAGEPA